VKISQSILQRRNNRLASHEGFGGIVDFPLVSLGDFLGRRCCLWTLLVR